MDGRGVWGGWRMEEGREVVVKGNQVMTLCPLIGQPAAAPPRDAFPATSCLTRAPDPGTLSKPGQDGVSPAYAQAVNVIVYLYPAHSIIRGLQAVTRDLGTLARPPAVSQLIIRLMTHPSTVVPLQKLPRQKAASLIYITELTGRTFQNAYQSGMEADAYSL
jgi:hypothetical protein